MWNIIKFLQIYVGLWDLMNPECYAHSFNTYEISLLPLGHKNVAVNKNNINSIPVILIRLNFQWKLILTVCYLRNF